MSYCKVCGATLTADSLFCEICGTRVTAAPAAPRYEAPVSQPAPRYEAPAAQPIPRNEVPVAPNNRQSEEPEDGLQRCVRCGNLLAPDSEFCPDCGCARNAQPVRAFCPSCGNPVPGEKKFCARCGAALPNRNTSAFAGNGGGSVMQASAQLLGSLRGKMQSGQDNRQAGVKLKTLGNARYFYLASIICAVLLALVPAMLPCFSVEVPLVAREEISLYEGSGGIAFIFVLFFAIAIAVEALPLYTNRSFRSWQVLLGLLLKVLLLILFFAVSDTANAHAERYEGLVEVSTTFGGWVTAISAFGGLAADLKTMYDFRKLKMGR